MMDNPDAVMKSKASVYSFGRGEIAFTFFMSTEDIILCSPFVCRYSNRAYLRNLQDSRILI
jgi:hypothetical protein